MGQRWSAREGSFQQGLGWKWARLRVMKKGVLVVLCRALYCSGVQVGEGMEAEPRGQRIRGLMVAVCTAQPPCACALAPETQMGCWCDPREAPWGLRARPEVCPRHPFPSPSRCLGLQCGGVWSSGGHPGPRRGRQALRWASWSLSVFPRARTHPSRGAGVFASSPVLCLCCCIRPRPI